MVFPTIDLNKEALIDYSRKGYVGFKKRLLMTNFFNFLQLFPRILEFLKVELYLRLLGIEIIVCNGCLLVVRYWFRSFVGDRDRLPNA